MDYSEYITKRVVQHLNEHGFFGEGIRSHKARGTEYVDILGISFGIDAKGGKLEVIIDPNETEEGFKKFKDYMARMDTSEFWEKPSLNRLKQQMGKYRRCLKNPETLRKADESFYRFRAELSTGNEDDIFFAVLNNIIRPVILYKTERN